MKLPNWFIIDTPVGPYNPDWAIIYESNNIKKLEFC
jgi:type III restriction enzyme